MSTEQQRAQDACLIVNDVLDFQAGKKKIDEVFQFAGSSLHASKDLIEKTKLRLQGKKAKK